MSNQQGPKAAPGQHSAHILLDLFTGTLVNISELSGVRWLIQGAQNNSFKYCCFLFNSAYLQLIANV